MTDAMAHRGPDGRGVELFPGDLPAGLGHRRLAIIDPTPAGAQPMSHRDRWWITYNGELYNFRELRRELEAGGERFRTACDTEVLLRMFTIHGPAMLERLNGIFALAVWDDEEKRLFLARDRLGVKPLYYTQQAGCFAFASELKALLPFLLRISRRSIGPASRSARIGISGSLPSSAQRKSGGSGSPRPSPDAYAGRPSATSLSVDS